MFLLHYLKIAWRNLLRHTGYTLLNSLALGAGIACVLLIFLAVQQQFTFDTFHRHSARIGRIVTDLQLDNTRYFSGVPYPMPEALRQEAPFLEKVAMMDRFDDQIVTVSGEKFKEAAGLAYAEPDLFQMLDFPLLEGDLEAFSEPNTALITHQTALKFYGTERALGRTFQAFEGKTFRVVGILKDMPANTACEREIFCAWATRKSAGEGQALSAWGNLRSNSWCFVLLRPGHSLAELQTLMPVLSRRYPHPVQKDAFQYRAYSLSELHFDTRYDGAFDKRMLWGLFLVGALLLFAAVANFVNLATAQAFTRAREVGVRKTMGSSKIKLFGQFMLETGLVVLLSFVAGLTLAKLTLPALNHWTGQDLAFSDLSSSGAIWFCAALLLLLTVLAGAYPGWVLSRFQPAVSLKGGVQPGQAGSFFLRQGLVGSQFAVAQLLIIGAVVVNLQMRYALDSDWGFRRAAMVTLALPHADKAALFKQAMDRIPAIKSISYCSAAPATDRGNQTLFRYTERPEPEKWATFFQWADDHYLKTFDIKLWAGSDFDANLHTPQCLVNETFAKKINAESPADIVGHTLTIEHKGILIKGIVADFHTGSFREQIPPLMLQYKADGHDLAALRLENGNPAPVLQQVEESWRSIFPDAYFEVQFLDDQIARFYTAEQTMLRMTNLFTGIAVFVGMLGLTGLCVFLVDRKRKEIGIRKVLGASVAGIVGLLAGHFLILVLIALAVASPVAYYLTQRWLADFAYHIELRWWMFAGSGAIAVIIALLTVGWLSIKAALANPTQSLKNE